MLPVVLFLIFCSLTSQPLALADVFSAIAGFMCIKSEFIENHPEISGSNARQCALLCMSNARCQAFTLADGPCQLFVFDRCSKSVRDCNCSRTGQVFVKQQPGLPPGKLCPSGYGDDLCGVKFKMYTDQWIWGPSRQKCEAESGLVIMADVMDAVEMAQVEALYTKYSVRNLWLGGFQKNGSDEPGGGFYWVSCNIALSNVSMWANSEPSNSFGGLENVLGRIVNKKGLCDFYENAYPAGFNPSYIPDTMLCECVSPFD